MSEKYSLEKAPEESESEKTFEQQKSEKEAFWNNKFHEVQAYQDLAGNKMDEGIMETVTALNVNDIPTTQSCAGHTEKGMMPWVQIQYPGRPEGIYKKSDVTPEYEKWREKEKAFEEGVKRLLEEFSSGRETKSGLTLKLDESNAIISINKDTEEIYANDPTGVKPLTKQEKAKLMILIPLAQEEMRAFSVFLKEKFFEE